MAGNVTGSRSDFIYISDDGTSYTVFHSVPKAAAGGFVAGAGSHGPLPKSYRMRGVFGVVLGSGLPDSAPEKTFLPVASPTANLYTGVTNTFTVTYPWGALTYIVTGIRGEKRYRLAAS